MNIDIEHIIGLKLSPDEYVFLLLHHKGEFDDYVSRGIRLRVDLKKLQDMEYIKILEDSKVAIRTKFIDLIETDFDRQFAELVGTYPMKVGTAGSLRVLHAADSSAKSNKKSKERYRKIVENNPAMHSRIIAALEIQLEQQRQNLTYMQLLEVWINNRTWEKWEGFKTEEQDGTRNTKILD